MNFKYLFLHVKKKQITFNENGKLALEYAKKIIDTSLEMKERLQAFDRSQHTIKHWLLRTSSYVETCTWSIKIFADIDIHSEIKSLEYLLDGLNENIYQIIITTGEINLHGIITQEYCHEQLYVSLPSAHPLAEHKTLSLNDLNGQSVLIFSNIGLWYDFCKSKMPDSMFLVQEELTALDKLRRSSALPSFATNLTSHSHNNENRILIPLTDPEVNITFYLNYKTSYAKQFSAIIDSI